MKTYKHALVKFNSGTGALLCNKCRIIIDYGFNHKDVEHYCKGCTVKQKEVKDEEQTWLRV